jgi:alkanesulfonate monooxygenase SsuD/methylene tetrahydromethanopterin reductase-like flavin-dependent oxidoreductase (luciferase family)
MKLGISVASAHRVDDPRDGARYMIERARAARAAGFDSLFVGDHHATPQPYYQTEPMLGRMLAEWGDAMAGALFLLPLWNPVLVAEQVATLACLHPGRFVLQCGLGAGRAQFEAMGANIAHRPSAFEAAVNALRALWRGETVSIDARFGNRDARISPLPPTPIDIWIGASAPPAIDRAARMGDAWLADPGMTLPVAAARIAQYREACAKYTRVPTTIPIRRDVYVGETLQAARRDMAPLLEGGYRGMDPEALVVGDIDSVTDTFARLGELGYDHVLVRNMTPDQSKALATIERLGEVRQRLATH